MADKPHPSRPYTPTAGREQSAGIASTREGEPRPVSTQIAEDIKGHRGNAEAKPRKKYALDADLAAMAAVDQIMVSLGRRDQISVLEWMHRKYGPPQNPDPIA